MTPIERAREYIHSAAQAPALKHPDLPEKLKGQIKNSNIWLAQFKRVGDLIEYMRRFQLGSNDPTYLALKKLGLATFEDIAPKFEKEFELWANDCTRPTDFVVGEAYSSHEILIFAKTYDTRAGGMFVLDSGGMPACVVIKATLSGGRYANEWIEAPNRLKYYLKSLKNEKTKTVTFGEHYKPNAAILKTKNIPILTFVRTSEADPFVYQGVFKYVSHTTESDGSKWFELGRNLREDQVVEKATFQEKVFSDEVKKSHQSPREERLKRLASAPKIPQEIFVLAKNYKRNPDVVVEVLLRANGHCEACTQPAPFLKRSDDSPYLEVHHKVQLAEGGEDTVENAIALCPNCHREKHFGKLLVAQ